MRNNSTWARSALSPTPWAPSAWPLAGVVFVALGVAVLSIAAPLAYFAFAVRRGLLDAHQPFANPEQVLVAQLVGYAPVALFLLAILPRLARVPLFDLGVRPPTPRALGSGILGTIAMWLLVSLTSGIVFALTKRHDTENAIALLQHMKTPVDQVAFFVLACVLAPMIEELIFRVFLFNALTRYVSVTSAIVGSGAIFGLVHALGAPATQLVTVAIPLAVGGMVLAYVYARTRNYWANVTTHGLFNAISVVAIFVFHAK